MNPRAIVPLALAVLFSLGQASVAASSPPGPGTISLHGHIGYGTQALGDVNDIIEYDEAVFQSAGASVSFDTFGGAAAFGGGLSFQASKSVGLGLDLGYQKSGVDNRYADPSASYSDVLDLQIIDLTGSFEIWVPAAPGLSFGANAGVGFGSADDEVHFRDYADPSNDVDINGEFSGSGLVAGAFAGYQLPVSDAAFVSFRGGYHFRNLGEFDGEVTSPQFGKASGPASDSAGQPIDFDFSGVFIRAGIGFSFGG